jgi:glutaconyl-CoA/methylmalonyl-CoA decarboxylase subunit gamma
MSEYVLSIGGREYRAEVKEMTADRARVLVDGKEYLVDLVQLGRKTITAPELTRAAAPRPASSTLPLPQPLRAAHTAGSGGVFAPLPGLILDLKVREGEPVQAGQTVLVMEAMKMENHINAPHNGTVRKVFVKNGDNVGEGDQLLEISRPEMTTL